MSSTINQRQLFQELIGIRVSLMRSEDYGMRPRYESPIEGFGFGLPSVADFSKPGFFASFLKQCTLFPITLLGIFVLLLFVPIVRVQHCFESRRAKNEILAEIQSFEDHAAQAKTLTDGTFAEFWYAYCFSDKQASSPLKMKLMKGWVGHLIGLTALEDLQLEIQLQKIQTGRGKTIMSGHEIGIVGVRFRCPYESIAENISAGIPEVPMPKEYAESEDAHPAESISLKS